MKPKKIAYRPTMRGSYESVSIPWRLKMDFKSDRYKEVKHSFDFMSEKYLLGHELRELNKIVIKTVQRMIKNDEA